MTQEYWETVFYLIPTSQILSEEIREELNRLIEMMGETSSVQGCAQTLVRMFEEIARQQASDEIQKEDPVEVIPPSTMHHPNAWEEKGG